MLSMMSLSIYSYRKKWCLLNEVQIFKVTRVNTAEAGLSFLTNITEMYYTEPGLSFATELESNILRIRQLGGTCVSVSASQQSTVARMFRVCFTASHRAPWVSR